MENFDGKPQFANTFSATFPRGYPHVVHRQTVDKNRNCSAPYALLGRHKLLMDTLTNLNYLLGDGVFRLHEGFDFIAAVHDGGVVATP